jgi:hypothetical protein
MERTPLTGSPAAADLKKLLIAGCQHPFHTEFGRGMEKPAVCGNGVDVRFGKRGGNTKGGLYFQIPPLDKKVSDFFDYTGSGGKRRALARQAPVACHFISSISR